MRDERQKLLWRLLKNSQYIFILTAPFITACGDGSSGGGNSRTSASSNVDASKVMCDPATEDDCPVLVRNVGVSCDEEGTTWTVQAAGQITLSDFFTVQTGDSNIDPNCGSIFPAGPGFLCSV